MTNERFNELLNGPLRGPTTEFTLLRITLALGHVVNGIGEPAEKILEDYCASREQQDEENAAYRPEEGEDIPF